MWQSHNFVSRTKFGFKFCGNSCDLIPRFVYHFGVWEPAVTRWIHSLKLSERNFIDVGAHLGWYTLIGAQFVGPKGRVIAIEASPSTFEGLERNVGVNDFRNVRLIPCAAWKEATELDLFPVTEWNTGTSSLVPEFLDVLEGRPVLAPSRRSVRIHARPLSEMLTPEEIRTAALLKIDTEGAELEVLEGLLPILPQFPTDLCILMEISPEVLSRRGRNADEIIRVLASYGFGAYALENEYQAEFYLREDEAEVLPRKIDGPIIKQTDVVFMREGITPVKN
ncbi:MAG: FkbM family methyltransferase [Bryobacteraceae bacterium]|jgi:FkbM family methyltransferase